MKQLAPIIYFAFNRPIHTRKTLEALSNDKLAQQSALWIFVDGPKENATQTQKDKIAGVINIVNEKKWCKAVNIIIAPINKGLIKSITDGVTKIVNQYGKVIVMEDDILVSPGFLTYMNDALNFYESNSRVMHISGFSRLEFQDLPINQSTYFFYHTTCWGWATWKRAWDLNIMDPQILQKKLKQHGNIYQLNMHGTYEFYWGLKSITNGKFQSWNYCWHASVFLNNGLCLHPSKSLVANIGLDGSGTNCASMDDTKNLSTLELQVDITPIPLENNEAVLKFNRKLFSVKNKIIFTLKHYLRYIVNTQ